MLGWISLNILYLVMSTDSVIAGNVRLAGSRHSNQGRVEVHLNGRWGTVCTTYWTTNEAKIVCRELGLPEATVALKEVVFPSGNTSTLMILDKCVGSESSLVNCSQDIAINNYCGERYKEVGVVCGKAVDEAFLVGGLSPNQGRLDVFLNGRYGSVCDDTWTMKEGQVVCGMLGYSSITHVVKNHLFGFYWRLSIIMGKVKCRGNETSLFECSFLEESDSCYAASVGLVCGRLSVKAQLVGGRSSDEGRIELAFGLQHMGWRRPWTLFCDSNWTIEDAAVICRMVGYQDAMFAVGADMFAESGGRYVLLQDLHCQGNETSLADCEYSGLKEHSLCPMVGVMCGKRNNTISLRLAGGSTSNVGRVELNLNGHWGTVCQNKWSLNNARVVCRSLGLQEASMATIGSVFGPGNGRIVLDNVECMGNESSLLECHHGTLGFKSCNSDQEAGVICGKTEVRFQISGNGSTRNQGVIEVNLNGINGSICNKGWDANDASVLCRMLGISDVGYPVNNQAFGPANGVTLLGNVSCYGNETDIMSCDRNDIGTKTGCSHGSDAGVICGPTKARLIGGPSWNHGRVEIDIDGVWNRAVWTVGYYRSVSDVICNMIGLPAMGYVVSYPFYSPNSNNSNFVSDINCHKVSAKSILECPFKYRNKVASPKDYQVTCGPPTGNVSILNVTSQASYISQPENALDDDPATCSFVNTNKDTFLNVTLNKEVYIHGVFLIVHNQSLDFEVMVQPTRSRDKSDIYKFSKVSCTSASKFKTKRGQIYKCSPPTLANTVVIKINSTNAKFGLCNVHVFVFENAAESQGSLHEKWMSLVDIRQGYLMKYNTHFTSEAYPVYTTKEFDIQQNNDGSDQGTRSSAFFTVPSAGNQKFEFLVSCDDNCELWLKQVAEEGLGKEATSLDYVIKAWFKTDPDVYNKHDNQRSQALSLSHCHMYYLEGYLTAYRGSQHMNVKLKPEGSKVLENLPKELLFWTLPGKRHLHFELSGTINGVLYVRFRSYFTIQASYSFCCQGLFCPSCPIDMFIRIGLSRGPYLVKSLPMDCSTHGYSENVFFDLQPDSYELSIEYSFVGDTTKWSHQRRMGTLVVSGSPRKDVQCLFAGKERWEILAYMDSVPHHVYRISVRIDNYKRCWDIFCVDTFLPDTVNIVVHFACASDIMSYSIFSLENILANCSFLNGLCPGWKVDGNQSSGLWTTREDLGIQMKIPGTSILESPLLRHTYYSSIKFCLNFAYKLPTNDTSFIKIINQNARNSTNVWYLTGFQGNNWNLAKVPLVELNNSKVIFAGFKSRNLSFIAIRDVQISTQICDLTPHFASPDFKCSKVQFKCWNGECVPLASRCNGVYDGCRDGSDENHCNCLSNQMQCNDECVTVDKVCDGRQDCRDGTDETHCDDREKRCDEVTCFDGSCNTWSAACQCSGCPIPGTCHVSPFECEMNKLNSFEFNKECSSLKGFCAFENGLCSFSNVENSSHSWIWTQSNDSPIKSILPRDHSTLTSNGSYVYLLQTTSSSSPKHLISQWIPAGRTLCLQLWFFIHGSSALNVYISTNLSIIKSWNHTGSTRGKWLFRQTSVEHNTEYRIVLEGANQNKRNFIAVDDVSFLEMECKPTTSNKENINCAFDVDMCAWKGDRDWKILNDPSLGSLLHLIGGSQSERHVNSPLFNPQKDDWKCLTFWFSSTLQFFQRSMKFVVVGEDGRELSSLWSYNASVKNITYVQVPLPGIDANVRVKLSGTKKQSQPVIAISNVLFLKEECQEIKPIAECHNYLVLDSIDRRVSNTIIKANILESLHWFTWYRITGAAGNQIPTSCIKENHCGSRYPIYAIGSNPTQKYQFMKYSLKMCKTFGQCCQTTGGLAVRHCGDFYVYQGLSTQSYDKGSQVCSTYKEVVPVYDKSQEWEFWINTEDGNQWKTAHYNQSSVDDYPNQTSPDMQEIHMMHDINIDVPLIPDNSYAIDRHTVLSICFSISASNGTFNIYLLNNSSSIFFNLSLSNNTIVLKIANESRSVDAGLFDGMWHHVCVTWESNWGLWHVFQDGYLLSKGMYLSDSIEVRGNIVMLDSRGAEGSNKNIRIARISNLNIWSKVLSGEEIVHMSYGCNVYRWGTLLSWYKVVDAAEKQHKHLIHRATCIGISISSRVLRSQDNSGSPSVGIFQSPWFNQSSDSNKECLMFKYKIKGKEQISLSVLQTLKYPNITDRRVWISNDHTGNAWRLGQVLITTMSSYKIKFKGQVSKDEYIAIGGLRVTSDRECLTTPEEAKHDVCNENMNSPKGLITTPNYPAVYPASSACKWSIKVQKGHVIRLEFKAFDVEDSEGCKAASLSVYDAGSLTGRYCGSIYPEVLESSTNNLMLSFAASKRNVYHNGFRIHYYAVKESRSKECIEDCPSECTCIKENNSLIIKGTDLFAIPTPLPRETTAIFFPSNKVFQLKPSDFVNLPSLKYINLEMNKILRMDNETFSSDNKALQTLKLAKNFLKEIPSNSLDGLSELKMLDLGRNRLHNIHPTALGDLHNLEILNLQRNSLTRLDPDLLFENTKLLYLYLQDNELRRIPYGLFRNQTKLRAIYLSNNQITEITKESFLGLFSLQELYLDRNDISEELINQETFTHLQNLRYLEIDSFMMCCYAKKTITGLRCESSDDNYLSSCEDLLKILALRVFIWILGILALLGNIGVIFYWNRMANIDPGDRGKKSRVQSFLLTNLAVSDLLMGIYLIIIAFHDSLWQDEYFKHDYEWRISIGCQISGALSMVSSEASVLILTTITADRFNSIVFHIKARPFSMKNARIVCAGIWIVSVLMSLAPFAFHLFYGHDTGIFFYGRSSVCLPLQLSTARPTGWEYAVFVYIAFNGCAFLFILLAYIAIFFKVKTSSKQVRSNMKKDSSLALRVVLIIVTDFCCWIPVVIIGCLSLAGKFNDSTGQAYAWIAVFVLPINSSINPLLYTFSNPQFRRLFNWRKLFNTCTGQTNEQSGKRILPENKNLSTGISGFDNQNLVLSSPRGTPLPERKNKPESQYFDTKL